VSKVAAGVAGAPVRGASAVVRWWILARPAGLWLPPLLPLLGYGWAHWDRALITYRPAAVVPVALAWVALQAGTLWLNAVRDRDQGEVLLGRAVPVPAGTPVLAALALLLSVALSALAGWQPAACAAGCVVLSVLYSHPRLAFKAHPVLGPAVNVLGYGVLSPLAGYAVVGTPLTWRTLATLLLLALPVLGWTFISQAFQQDEDRRRGDRTLVATHGPRAVLRAGRLALGSAASVLVLLVVLGWYPPAVLLALVGAVGTDVALARWSRDLQGGERRARSVLRLGVLTLALTLAGAVGDYAWDTASGGPVAGLATPAGLPPDRRPRPAPQQIRRDAEHRAHTGAPYRPL